MSGEDWTVSDGQELPPIAAAGGWHAGRLRLSVLFLESPHRLELDLDPGSRRAGIRWTPPPLFELGQPGFGSLWAPRPFR